MSIVVSDTSPVRALHFLGRMDLLGSLFGKVWVPTSVDGELRRPRPSFKPVEVSSYGINVAAPRDAGFVARLRQTLDVGEAEALALAVELSADRVLIDEVTGRAAAQSLGLRPTGVLGVLVEAKQKRLVGQVAPLIDRLQSELRFFISPPVRAQAPRKAGENE